MNQRLHWIWCFIAIQLIFAAIFRDHVRWHIIFDSISAGFLLGMIVSALVDEHFARRSQ